MKNIGILGLGTIIVVGAVITAVPNVKVKALQMATDFATWGHEQSLVDTVRIEGNRVVSTEKIAAKIPQNKPITWWMENETKIESDIMTNPLISEVEIHKCAESKMWGCIVVSITERKAEYIVRFNGEPWLVGSDGVFLVKLNDFVTLKRLKKIYPDITERPILEGIADPDLSVDRMQGRLIYAKLILERSEKILGMNVKSLNLALDGETRIQYAGVPFVLKLDYLKGDEEQVNERLLRFKLILDQMKGRYSEMEQVDLGFESIGVVKLHNK